MWKQNCSAWRRIVARIYWRLGLLGCGDRSANSTRLEGFDDAVGVESGEDKGFEGADGVEDTVGDIYTEVKVRTLKGFQPCAKRSGNQILDDEVPRLGGECLTLRFGELPNRLGESEATPDGGDTLPTLPALEGLLGDLEALLMGETCSFLGHMTAYPSRTGSSAFLLPPACLSCT